MADFSFFSADQMPTANALPFFSNSCYHLLLGCSFARSVWEHLTPDGPHSLGVWCPQARGKAAT
jgi:hypothetical protein